MLNTTVLGARDYKHHSSVGPGTLSIIFLGPRDVKIAKHQILGSREPKGCSSGAKGPYTLVLEALPKSKVK